MSKGLFIAIEGGDFTGKTTFADQLKEVLSEAKIPTNLIRSPGGDDVGEKIRELLTTVPLSEAARTLIFSANRVESSNNIIRPLLEKGEIVISTRWRWSSNVYQDNKTVSNYIDHTFSVCQPDIYILLECSDEVMVKSMEKRANGQLDILDVEYTQDFKKVRTLFQEQYETHDGLCFRYVYNEGNDTPPTNEEFIELCKDFLTEIGYFELPQVITNNSVKS